MDQHRSAEADDELRQERLEDEHELKTGWHRRVPARPLDLGKRRRIGAHCCGPCGIIWSLHARHFDRVDRRRFYRFTAVCRQL